MSVKKSKLDLLVRVRYQNPLPAPPFPPKLLQIPTTPARYVQQGAEFTAALANETPLPMAVDADLGVPIDLSLWDCLWFEDEESEKALNPQLSDAPLVDPKDAFMLSEMPAPSGSQTNGFSSSQNETPQVSWLRKTEYISREGVSRSQGSASQDIMKQLQDTTIDVSRPAQIQNIEASFAYSEEPFDLSNLKHPNKPGVTAVESYEVLPDTDIWANAYDLFKFSERPGERHPDLPDPRLDCAILRPMESDGDHFLAYYLPKEDETAENFKLQRRTSEEVEETVFSFVRDYETVKIEQEVPNEFLLVLDDGNEDEDDKASMTSPTARRRGKGAFYKGIERKITLKKKRVNQWDNISYTDKWDAINLTLASFTEEEHRERAEALTEVVDPQYYMREADAEGEDDDTQQEAEVKPQPLEQNGVDALVADVFGGDEDERIEEHVNGV